MRLCHPPQSLSCDSLSPLSVGSHSRSEKPGGILTYYHGGKKTGGFEVRLLGLNLNFLTVLPYTDGFTFSALVSSSVAWSF